MIFLHYLEFLEYLLRKSNSLFFHALDLQSTLVLLYNHLAIAVIHCLTYLLLIRINNSIMLKLQIIDVPLIVSSYFFNSLFMTFLNGLQC